MLLALWSMVCLISVQTMAFRALLVPVLALRALTCIRSLPAPAWLADSDTGLAWQALAGVRAPISDSWDVGLKYRFFNAPNVDLVDRLGRDVSTRFRSHSLMGSLVYNFGGEEVVAGC